MYPATQLEEQQYAVTFFANRVEALARQVDEKDAKIRELEAHLLENTHALRDAVVKEQEAERVAAQLEAAQALFRNVNEANVAVLARAEKAEAELESERTQHLSFIAEVNARENFQAERIAGLQADLDRARNPLIELGNQLQGVSPFEAPKLVLTPQFLESAQGDLSRSLELDRLAADLKELRTVNDDAKRTISRLHERALAAEERALAMGTWAEQHWDDIPYHRDTLRIALGRALPIDQTPTDGARRVMVGDGFGRSREVWMLQSDPVALTNEPVAVGGDVKRAVEGLRQKLNEHTNAVPTPMGPAPALGATVLTSEFLESAQAEISQGLDTDWRPGCSLKPTLPQMIAYLLVLRDRNQARSQDGSRSDRGRDRADARAMILADVVRWLGDVRLADAGELDRACEADLRAVVKERDEWKGYYEANEQTLKDLTKERDRLRAMLDAMHVANDAKEARIRELTEKFSTLVMSRDVMLVHGAGQVHTVPMALETIKKSKLHDDALKLLNGRRLKDAVGLMEAIAHECQDRDYWHKRALAVEEKQVLDGYPTGCWSQADYDAATDAMLAFRKSGGDWIEKPTHAAMACLNAVTYRLATAEPAQASAVPGSVEALTEAARLIFGGDVAITNEPVVASLVGDSRIRGVSHAGIGDKDAVRKLIAEALIRDGARPALHVEMIEKWMAECRVTANQRYELARQQREAVEPGSYEALVAAIRLIFGCEIAAWERSEDHVAGWEAVLLRKGDDRGRGTGMQREDALRHLIADAISRGVAPW